jgi:hypothetical protein
VSRCDPSVTPYTKAGSSGGGTCDITQFKHAMNTIDFGRIAMREGWLGDIADFAKFAFLRRLAQDDLRLGLLWYLTTHAGAKPPKRGYLKRPGLYRTLDPGLFDSLQQLHHASRTQPPTLRAFETSDILPKGTAFYSHVLSTTDLNLGTRLSARKDWFDRGQRLVSSCDLVFLDPDTGLLPPKDKLENDYAEEYASVDEVALLRRKGHSVACVQFGRPGNLEPKQPILARQRLGLLRDALADAGLPRPWGLWWPVPPKFALLMAPATDHEDRLNVRRDMLINDPAWDARVELL